MLRSRSLLVYYHLHTIWFSLLYFSLCSKELKWYLKTYLLFVSLNTCNHTHKPKSEFRGCRPHPEIRWINLIFLIRTRYCPSNERISVSERWVSSVRMWFFSSDWFDTSECSAGNLKKSGAVTLLCNRGGLTTKPGFKTPLFYPGKLTVISVSLRLVGISVSVGFRALDEEIWIKMAVNLSKNGSALMAAYKDVVDGRSDTNWWGVSHEKLKNFDFLIDTPNCFIFTPLCVFRALFTYEGNSNDIRLAEKGGEIYWAAFPLTSRSHKVLWLGFGLV